MEKIPKVIHYIWFGKNEKSELILKCIESWKKYLPDWKFIEWNEKNYDVNKSKYMKKAYEEKKYAFVADYARFDIIYNYGGIYLDTDVELLKPLPEKLLELDGFSGVESNNKIATGLILAATKNNEMIKEVIEKYDTLNFEYDKNMPTVVDIVTEIFKKYGFKENGKKQTINNFVIFPSEYFCGYDLDIREPAITNNTISIHHYAYSWGKRNLSFKIKMQIKKMIGVKKYKELLKIKRRFCGVKKK